MLVLDDSLFYVLEPRPIYRGKRRKHKSSLDPMSLRCYILRKLNNIPVSEKTINNYRTFGLIPGQKPSLQEYTAWRWVDLNYKTFNKYRSYNFLQSFSIAIGVAFRFGNVVAFKTEEEAILHMQKWSLQSIDHINKTS